MSQTVQELFEEGHRKVVCVNNRKCYWWTVGKVYTIDDDGRIVDDYGDDTDYDYPHFEPSTETDLDNLASAVAEKVFAMIKERL